MSKFIIGEKVRFSVRDDGGYKKIFDIAKVDSIQITKKGIYYGIVEIETGECFDIKEDALWKIKKEYSLE